MNIQQSEEFKTSKFFCKTNFNMKEIKAEEADYKNYPLPKSYNFKSEDSMERILYANFRRIDNEVNDMVMSIFSEFSIDSKDLSKDLKNIYETKYTQGGQKEQ